VAPGRAPRQGKVEGKWRPTVLTDVEHASTRPRCLYISCRRETPLVFVGSWLSSAVASRPPRARAAKFQKLHSPSCVDDKNEILTDIPTCSAVLEVASCDARAAAYGANTGRSSDLLQHVCPVSCGACPEHLDRELNKCLSCPLTKKCGYTDDCRLVFKDAPMS
jgi:hypothetical protein